MVGGRSRVIFLTLLIVSILLHSLAWKWLDLREWINAKQVNEPATTTVQITLRNLPSPFQKQPPPEVPINKEPVPEEHQPVHNAENFASSNNTDRSVTKIPPGEPPNIKGDLTVKELQSKSSETKKEQLKTKGFEELNEIERQIVAIDATSEKSKNSDLAIKSNQSASLKEPSQIAQNEQFEKVLNESSLSTEFKFQGTETNISDEMLASLGNMKLLDDYHLDDIEVKEPFSEIEAKRIRMVNRYLEQMEKQIRSGWLKPGKNNKQLTGVIKFSLNPYGYLSDAYIFLGSGDSVLDQSALEAVKAVKKFAVPESALVAAKYYSHLRFQYSSQDFAGESIPIPP